MSVASKPGVAVDGAPVPVFRSAPGGGRVVRAASVAVGAALAFIVVRDGSPAWQLTRLVTAGGLTWLAHRVLTRSGRVGRAGAAFAQGCVAFAVGIGIGLPHLVKTGLQATTVAGLVALAGGLVLVGTGAAGLVRLSRSWRRLLVVPGLFLAFFVTVWSLAQATAATNVPRTDVGATTPAERGLSYRDVRFATADGVSLSGWYVPSANRAAVVLLHGAGSTRSNVLDHAAVLANHGYGVLLFDSRGHGRSGGRAMDFGWYGDQDTAAAVSFLTTQPDVDPARIAAIGMSMGGEEAIGAAASDTRIRAVVAEGATNRVTADKAWMSEEFGWRGTFSRGLEWLVYNTADLLTAGRQPIPLREAAAAAAPRPILLIAAGDVADEATADRYIQAGSPQSVEVWVVPDTGHTAALDTHPQEWEQRVTAFLATAVR